jgi:hypothetical protein
MQLLIVEFCEESKITTGCEECKKKYCGNCFNALHVPKKLQNHKSTPITELKIEFCSKHPKDFAGYFCFKDKSFICAGCTISEHKEHHPVEIKDAIHINRSDLDIFDKEIKISVQKIEESILEEMKFYTKEKVKLEEKILELNSNSNKKVNNLKMSKKIFQNSEILLKNFEKNLNLKDLMELKEIFLKEQCKIALCYKNGQGIPKDSSKAVEIFTLASDLGYSDAQYNLGFCYENGDGVPRDIKKAIELYRLAIDQGHPTAKNNLGFCYKKGCGVEKDLSKAIVLFTLAADQNDCFAQYNLGFCYQNGEEVPKDLKKSREFFTLAANQGDPDAQFCLAVYYQNGEGGPKDLEKAIQLFKLAADQGLSIAQNKLKQLKF